MDKTINLNDIIEDKDYLTQEFILSFLKIDSTKAVLNLTLSAQADLVKYESLLRIVNSEPNSNFLVISSSKNTSQQFMKPFLEHYLQTNVKNYSLTYKTKNNTIYFDGYRSQTWQNHQYSYVWLLVGINSNPLANISKIVSDNIVILDANQSIDSISRFDIPTENIIYYK